MKKNILYLILLSSFLLANSNDISVHGFGTLGVTYQSNEDIIYRSSSLTDKGPQGDLSFATDSRFGLQLDYKVNSNTQLTLQGTVDAKNTTLEWANIKYNFNYNTNIKIGKMRIPASMYTDILKVGYSYHWARLPDELYGILPLTSYWGAEINHDFYYHNIDFHGKIFAGYSTNRVIDTLTAYDYDLTLKNLIGIELQSQINNLELKVTYLHTNLILEDEHINQFFDTSIQDTSLSTQTTKQLQRLNPENTKTHYLSLGIKYDTNTFFIAGEYVWEDMKSIIASNTAKYITMGLHLGLWTPHLTYSEVSGSSKYYNNTIADSEINTTLIEIIQGSTIAQKKYTLGLRHDYATNIAIKCQYDHIKEKNYGRGISIHLDDLEPTTLDVFTLSLDFIF